VTEVHVVSRAASPTEVRPWLEDSRRLGVYVGRILLRSANDVQEVPVDHSALSQGWWTVERNGIGLRRWTDGNALLRLPITDALTILEIHAAGSGLMYRVDGEAQRSAA
jgi:hypothetical protein